MPNLTNLPKLRDRLPPDHPSNILPLFLDMWVPLPVPDVHSGIDEVAG